MVSKRRLRPIQSCVSLSSLAKASKLRVAVYENRDGNGHDLKVRALALRETLCNSEYLSRRVQWKDWYSRSFILNLHKNKTDLGERGIDARNIRNIL